MSWILLAATVARSCQRLRTALLRPQGQRGGDKRALLLPLDGEVVRRRLLLVAGEVLHPAEEAVVEAPGPGGVQVQVLGLQLGHPPQQGGGVPTQRQVRGVQEAAAGEQAAAQLETPAGVARIRRRKAAGTCDTYHQ